MLANFILFWIDLTLLAHGVMISYDWIAIVLLVLHKYAILANDGFVLVISCILALAEMIVRFKPKGIFITVRKLLFIIGLICYQLL